MHLHGTPWILVSLWNMDLVTFELEGAHICIVALAYIAKGGWVKVQGGGWEGWGLGGLQNSGDA